MLSNLSTTKCPHIFHSFNSKSKEQNIKYYWQFKKQLSGSLYFYKYHQQTLKQEGHWNSFSGDADQNQRGRGPGLAVEMKYPRARGWFRRLGISSCGSLLVAFFCWKNKYLHKMNIAGTSHNVLKTS